MLIHPHLVISEAQNAFHRACRGLFLILQAQTRRSKNSADLLRHCHTCPAISCFFDCRSDLIHGGWPDFAERTDQASRPPTADRSDCRAPSGFSKRQVKSTTETSGVGTRKAMPVSLPQVPPDRSQAAWFFWKIEGLHESFWEVRCSTLPCFRLKNQETKI